jgi:hypothetical protein
MSTKRTPIARHPAPRITPRALDPFERGKRLKARGKEDSREFSDVSYALDVELQQKPWQESALDVDTDEPPDYMRTPAEIADYRRARHQAGTRGGATGPTQGRLRGEARTEGRQGRARSAYAPARILTLHASLERIGPVLDREVSALFDHDLMGRDRRARRLGGLHIARNFRPVERGSGPDADSRGNKSSYCSQNDDLAHGVTLCGM